MEPPQANHAKARRIDLAHPLQAPDRQQDFAVKGICPPTRPVLPTCGTTPIASALASARTRKTSSVEPGRTTTPASLVKLAPSLR
jgi:hypothetical protein